METIMSRGKLRPREEMELAEVTQKVQGVKYAKGQRRGMERDPPVTVSLSQENSNCVPKTKYLRPEVIQKFLHFGIFACT